MNITVKNTCKIILFFPEITFVIVAFSWDVDQLPWNVREKKLLYEEMQLLCKESKIIRNVWSQTPGA